METTRHFTATTYVVESGATVLHEHDRIGKWLPPGGHVDRGEVPHEAAVREVREETGLAVSLRTETDDIGSPTVESLPQPEHMLLADVNFHGGEVGHQHIDHVFYAEADSRDLSPADGEEDASAWEWFTPADLRNNDELDPDVAEIGQRAIAAVDGAGN
ncbi:NUDIX hydrolase [Halostella salina]|uniref:NUDIX hydrolase n=1 Tax=Halostella salina TaxID=1547897 RepID=UPI000EF80BA5|nr:NUDIX hydrolase [Halostella salina]